VEPSGIPEGKEKARSMAALDLLLQVLTGAQCSGVHRVSSMSDGVETNV
jgi:hypothetical protein